MDNIFLGWEPFFAMKVTCWPELDIWVGITIVECFISEQFNFARVLGWERSLAILKLFANEARTHVILHAILRLLDLLFVVETKSWLFEQILIELRSSSLGMLLKGTILTLLLSNSAFLWIIGMHNRFVHSLTQNWRLLNVPFILSDAGGIDLVRTVECEFFIRGGFGASRWEEIFGVVHGLSADGGLCHHVCRSIILLVLCLIKEQSRCNIIRIMNPNMVNNELYMEVKHKWRSIYPIYFDSSKTLQQGTTSPTQVDDCPKINVSKNPLSSNLSELSALAS